MEMQPPGQVHSVGPCDICGDIGYHEVIVTCMKCKINCEHIYCMRINLTKVPEDWICEPCQSKTDTTPCRVNQVSVPQPTRRQRAVTTGKVKFLPEDEVIKLSSGNFFLKPIQANSTLPITRKASAVRKNVISKTPSLTIKPNPKILPKVLVKNPRNGEVNKNPTNNRHASGTLSKGPTKELEHFQENQQLQGGIISDEIDQALDPQKEKLTKRASFVVISTPKSVPIVDPGGIHGAGSECNNSNVERNNRHSIREDFNCHHKLLLSSIIPWRGQFQILRPAVLGEFYDGFEAQPPCLVSSKAFQFSQKLPTILQLETVPASIVLTDLFLDGSPSLDDIALYFLPSIAARSREKLDSILKIMNAEKLMLRSFIDGVELLIFTSNELDMDSQGTIASINAGCFLWGIFRVNKTDSAIERSPEMEPIDMDIDMIGGKDVMERVDHVKKVHSELLDKSGVPPGFEKHARDPLVSSKVLRKKTSSEFFTSPSSLTKDYSKSLDMLVVPPGFEALVGTKVKEEIPPAGFEARAVTTEKEEKHMGNDRRSAALPGFEGTKVKEEKGTVNDRVSAAKSACFVGHSGRGSVHPPKFMKLSDLK